MSDERFWAREIPMADLDCRGLMARDEEPLGFMEMPSGGARFPIRYDPCPTCAYKMKCEVPTAYIATLGLKLAEAQALSCENTRAEGCCMLANDLVIARDIIGYMMEELSPKEADPYGNGYSYHNYVYCPGCEAETKAGDIDPDHLFHKPGCRYIAATKLMMSH